MRWGLSFALWVAAGCMQTQSASLGAQEQAVPHGSVGDASAAHASDSSAAPDHALPHDEHQDEHELNEQDHDTPHDDDEHAPDAAWRDAAAESPLREDAQIGRVDGGAADAAVIAAGRDAASEDAGQPINPICRIEPWHCL